MKSKRAAQRLVLTSLLFSSNAAPLFAQTIESQIRQQIESYREAWNTHDAPRLAGFFAEDADFVMYNLPAREGRPAILAWWASYFANQEPQRELTLDVVSLQALAPDVAVVTVQTTTGGPDAGNGELTPRRARGTWLMSRSTRGWLISAMLGYPKEQDRVVLNDSKEVAETLHPQIRSFVRDYEDAFNRRDPTQMGVLFQNDADIIVRNGTRIQGRQAIQDWWRTYFSEPRPYRALLIVDRIRMMNSDIALLNVTATGAPRDPHVRDLPTRVARGSWIIVWGAEGWRIAALRILPSEWDEVIRASDR